MKQKQDSKRLKGYLRTVQKHKKPYRTSVNGVQILVHPENVMSPRYCRASRFAAQVVDSLDLHGRNVLEIGSGSGVLSVMAAKAGAAHITALDINPYAVLNTQDNFALHKINGTARLSDLFSAVAKNKKFDLIIFEAPYYDLKPQSFLERGIADEGYKTLTRFFEDTAAHLKKDGKMLVGFSPYYGDFAVLQNLITTHRYKVERHYHKAADNRSWSYMLLRR